MQNMTVYERVRSKSTQFQVRRNKKKSGEAGSLSKNLSHF